MAISLYHLGLFAIVVLVIRKFITYVRVLRFKKKYGCKPEKRLPQFERLIGYGLYRTQINAGRNKEILKVAKERYDLCGPTWSCSMMGMWFYNTTDPENMKALLATNFKDFGLGKRQDALGPFLGQGIFTTDGKQWEHSRSLIRPNFTRSQVSDLAILETHIQHLITRIPTSLSTVDLQPLFFQLTLDTATSFLFGESVNSLLSIPGSPQDKFEKAYDLAQSRLSNRLRLGKLVKLVPDREFDEACKVVHEFVDSIVFRALEKVQSTDVEKVIDGEGVTEKQRYVFLTEMLKATRDPKRIRDELLNILLAGRDTTASLLSNTFHVLARRKDVWEKLKREVDELGGQKPDYEKLRGMRYLKYLLNETLRLYPVVPATVRFANRDTTLPRGGGPSGTSPIFIPAGSVVAYHTSVMHRRKDIYGPDAEEFKPERWEAEKGLRPGWGYLPFSGGPRVCVGQQFALTEAGYTIVRLVQSFGEIIDRDGGEWVEQLTLTLCSGKGVKVALVPR